jgi:GNAT superfamily N-acetyltransferase
LLTIVPVTSAAHLTSARELISEYLHWIQASAQREYGLEFDVDAMVASDFSDTGKFKPPHGRFYLVYDGESAVGVGCLKRLSEQTGELQRMYVKPECRGEGAGRLLLNHLIADARDIGYRTLRLESLKFLNAAHTLYRSAGFAEIDPYSGNSMEKYHAAEAAQAYRVSVVFMELAL